MKKTKYPDSLDTEPNWAASWEWLPRHVSSKSHRVLGLLCLFCAMLVIVIIFIFISQLQVCLLGWPKEEREQSSVFVRGLFQQPPPPLLLPNHSPLGTPAVPESPGLQSPGSVPTTMSIGPGLPKILNLQSC